MAGLTQDAKGVYVIAAAPSGAGGALVPASVERLLARREPRLAEIGA